VARAPRRPAVPPALRRRLAKVRLVVFDVDGVLTDGGLYYGADGGVTKRFDVHDGHGLVTLRRAGYVLAFLSAETSPAVEARARKLGVEEVRQGVAEKAQELDALARKHGAAPDEILYMGDDEVDLAPMAKAGVAVAVAGAVPAVRAAADYVTERPGGRGAAREVAEMLLSSRPAAAR
jgi:3-deoxy-D-manno-octulosonate 8-phosphate phosphatase (KDO 8-P phosphatase)